jgi:hypothetical protein
VVHGARENIPKSVKTNIYGKEKILEVTEKRQALIGPAFAFE